MFFVILVDDDYCVAIHDLSPVLTALFSFELGGFNKNIINFPDQKNNRFEDQNMGGGDKRHVIPPMSKHVGDISPPSPPGFTPLPRTQSGPEALLTSILS